MSVENKSSSGFWISALAAVIGFGAVYLTFARSDNDASPQSPAPAISASETPAKAETKSDSMAAFVTKKTPEALPDITFNDGAGNAIKLSSFKGKTVLLNLWATWCAPCREEMPSLDRLQQALGSDKFEVVALSLDRAGLEASKKFLDDVKANALKLYVDATARQGLALKLVGMPTTILINAEGLEVGRLAGPAEWDSPEAKKLIEAAIK
jgi:thiol-disulfide isomerase/thioredoxin